LTFMAVSGAFASGKQCASSEPPPGWTRKGRKKHEGGVRSGALFNHGKDCVAALTSRAKMPGKRMCRAQICPAQRSRKCHNFKPRATPARLVYSLPCSVPCSGASEGVLWLPARDEFEQTRLHFLCTRSLPHMPRTSSASLLPWSIHTTSSSHESL
jgi:hypothetical protein